MAVVLIVIKGPDEGKRFRLLDGEMKTLGRGSQCEIILSDVRVSRQHCRARIANGTVAVQDLESRNGTLVNGARRVGEVALHDGDVVEVGCTRLSVHFEPAAAATPGQAAARTESSRSAGIEAPFIRANLEPMPPPPGEETEDSVMGILQRRAGRPAAKRPNLIGTVVGGCRIEELLGEDDISRAYRATQLSMERAVLLKILLEDMTRDRRAIDRFIQAARAGGKLSHPNIVQVYDAGEERGVHFVALELVKGKSIRQLLQERGRNRPLTLRHAVDIAEQVAGALDYAHAQSVIHRNVTPDNILVGADGMAKLVNLGFAENLAESAIQRPASPDERMDALCYAAPEQFADPPADTAQSDVYSLGAVLFHMLAGRPPFSGASEQEIIEHIRKGDRQAIRRIQRDVPEELARVVERAMATEPAGRFQRALELQAEIRQARDRLRL